MRRCFDHLLPAGLCLLALLTAGATGNADTTSCRPDAAPDNTGSVYGPAPQDSAIVAWRTPGPTSGYYHEVGYARFSLAPLPEDVLILGVTLHFYVNDASGHATYKITPLELDPLVTTDYWMRWDISADAGSRYPYVKSTDNTIGWHEVGLGFEGVSRLRQGIDAGWFGVGFFNQESGIRVNGWAEVNTPYIVVEHRPGPSTYHVDDDAPFDPGPGDPTVSDPLEDGSAAHPFDSIQEALDVVYWDGGNVTEEVLVADGTYTGPGNRDITIGAPVVHLRSANGPENCIIDCQGSESDPHRGFIINTEGPHTLLEGFTITGGYADKGGAIYCGVIYLRDVAAPVIKGNVITGNTANVQGGGIYVYSFSEPVITGNIITGNQAGGTGSGYGGGVYCRSGTVTGNVIENNQALGSSAGGGGIYAAGHVVGNIVTGNHSQWGGGGIYISPNDQPVVVANNVVTNNTAHNGAGISDARTLVHCTVTGNVASSYGGGFRAGNASEIIDCIIEGNQAPTGNEIVFDSAPHYVSYSNIDRDLNDIYETPLADVTWGPGMLDEDSLFTAGAGGDHYLSQLAAGQLADSPCVDGGSGLADEVLMPLGWSMTDGTTTSWATFSGCTTATNFAADTGTVDMGYHYPALSTVTGRLTAAPAAGVLPFSTNITIKLENNYTGLSRRIAGRLDLELGGGESFSNWRAGWANIAAGANFRTSWFQTIPALPSLLGSNTFTLHAWDVTPAPYNQQPYPSSGDSDSDESVVIGIAP